MKKNVIKICEIILCVVLLVGFVGYYKFSTSAEFNPTAARDFNRNIVESKNNQKKEDANSSEGNLWKKDENSMDNEASNADNSSNYTNNNQAEETPQDNAAQQTIASTTESGDNNPQSSEGTTEEDKKTADTVYDVVDGKDKGDEEPDIIIPSEKNPDNTVPAGKDDKDSDNGTVIIKPGDNNSSDIPGGSGNNDKPSSKPEYVPTDEIKDPEFVFDTDKKGSGNYFDPDNSDKNIIFKDDIVSDVINDYGTDFLNLHVSVPDGAFYQLFQGGTFSDLYVFYCLDTYIYDFSTGRSYYFLEDTYGPNGNFQITGVSLDDGNTWITKFPFTIPEDQKTGVKIRYAYRFSTKDTWTEMVMGEIIGFDEYLPVYESRIYVLNQKINANNPAISTDMVVNPYNQYNRIGDTFYLNRFQEYLFKSNNWIDKNKDNTVLFPGWVENGNPVGNIYKVTAGRHVFQPMDPVAMPDGIKVKMKYYFLDPDDYTRLECLQTLYTFDRQAMQNGIGRSSSRIAYVPEYIQSIELDQSPFLTCSWMEIPSTVMYMDEETSVYVTDGFIVDEDNPYYSSSEDGLLLSKDKTEILGIPSGKTSIVIQPGIQSVHFTYSSSVKEITILANSMDEMPELDLSRLNGATIHVQSSIMDEFVNENYDVLESSGISITSIADEGMSYIIDNGLQIGNDNGLYHSFNNVETLLITNNISSVKSGAFEGTSTSTLILPEDGTVIDFESGSLKNSSIQTVFCYTKKQEEEVTACLNKDGLMNVKVVLTAMSADGNYQYYAENGVYTLVKAYNSPEIYDGSLVLDNGEKVYVNEIAGGAFKGNTTLKVVNLNESVKKIGTQAFMNCTNLEGFMINSTDVISIGDKAVDGCYNLRFMASNANEGIMENNYGPQVYNMGGNISFYIPTGATGYNNATYFTAESGVFGYKLIDNSLLYGLDMTESPWLLINASRASGTVNIDSGTVEIFSYAFAGLMDEFTIPFERLDPYNDFIYVDAAAFQNSGITDVTIDKGACIYDEAFYGCSNLTEFTVNGNVTLEDNVLMECSNLEKVTFGKLYSYSLRPNMFFGCDKLSELNLNGYYDYYERGPSLMVYENQPFRFNTNWESEYESTHLKINLDKDIDVDNLISEWRYGFLGYADLHNSSYIDLWEHCQAILQMTLDNGKPTVEQVDEAVKQELLSVENRIRTMLGADLVEEPVPYILYSQITSKVEGSITINSITIRGTSGPMESIDLDDRMDLPISDEIFYDFVVQKGAFVNNPNLRAIFLPGSSATVFQDGFLSGVQSNEVGIWNMSGPIPELEVKEEGVPFSFGIEDEKINIMFLIDKEALFDEWKYALVGYSSQETFEETMIKQLKEEQPELEEGSDEYKEALENLENKKLAEASGRLDTMFTDMSRDK